MNGTILGLLDEVIDTWDFNNQSFPPEYAVEYAVEQVQEAIRMIQLYDDQGESSCR